MELNSAITKVNLKANAKLFDQFIEKKRKFDLTNSEINLELISKLFNLLIEL